MNEILPMRSWKPLLLVVVAAAFAVNPFARAQGNAETVSTSHAISWKPAKGGELHSQIRELTAMVKARQFKAAAQKAIELRKAYEGLFDSKLKQYTFMEQVEYEDFRKASVDKFEWIDWGYKECLQMQAFMASDQRDFPGALVILKTMESIAPFSAGTLVETGYILNQMGKAEEGLATYRRAYEIAVRYVSQRADRAPALRGMGFALIDLKQLDEAEAAFQKSLEIEPGNKLAFSELAYIRGLRGGK